MGYDVPAKVADEADRVGGGGAERDDVDLLDPDRGELAHLLEERGSRSPDPVVVGPEVLAVAGVLDAA